jgi:5-methylcytosine-specific restriction endonuclease McrA
VEHKTLVLTNWFFPYQILGWRDATIQVCTGNSIVIASYEEPLGDPEVNKSCPPELEFVPAVVRLAATIKPKRRVKFSRFNVFTRDNFTCQYCGQKKVMRQLTFDHMVPRKRGGLTRWNNIVTACVPCNSKKGSLTCDEAGMFPRRDPIRPTSLPLVSPVRDLEWAPTEWHEFVRPYLPTYA